LSAEETYGRAGVEEPVAVKVWVWSLDEPPRAEADMLSWLSADEIARADRFQFPHLRRRWIAARAGMRSLLGAQAGMAPAALTFGTGHNGKPFLRGRDGPCTFNLSHSEGVGALAVSSEELGVDVERIGRFHDGVARHHFSPMENMALDGLPEGQRNVAFYRFWTAKEAVLKALGTGFSLASNSFTIDITKGNAPQLVEAGWPEGGIGAWQIRTFEPHPGFDGAVAVRTGHPVRLSVARWA
jgi:4'-phosphopantetheinyl transferase